MSAAQYGLLVLAALIALGMLVFGPAVLLVGAPFALWSLYRSR